MRRELIANHLAELDGIITELLPLIQSRRTVALVGEIGAGKTTFTKLLCQRLGVTETTSSPTYAIINQYQAGQTAVYHVDLYRLKTPEEVIDIGLLELLEDKECYCIIEWPELITDELPEETLWIKITPAVTGERKFEIYCE